MTKGWFMGNFNPTLHSTNDFEVAVKRYKAGDYDASHYHLIATETTVIVTGRVRMNGVEFVADDIIIIDPGIHTDFLVLEDAITVVVKTPGASNDKYDYSTTTA
jgi:hypothetical protein